MTLTRAGALGAVLLLVSLLAANAPAALADEGSATWYGQPYHGRRMANGQIYDMYDPTTTACNLYPLGTWLRVVNPSNDREIVVQVRDRGYFRHALDLSYAAFKALADPGQMRLNVQFEVVSGPDGGPVESPPPANPPPAEESAPPAEPDSAPDTGTSGTGAESPPASGQYEIQPGETLAEIAGRFGVSVDDLIAWNGIEDPDLVSAGQQIAVQPGASGPGSEPSSSSSGQSSGGSVYIVQEGDMLWQIAESHGLTVGALVAANALDPEVPIHPGQELVLPGGAGGAPADDQQWYEVQDGDTLVNIAEQFQISSDDLLALNGLDDPDLIHPGQQLRVR